MQATCSTPQRLRQQAMVLVQQRGYHGFSYRDLAQSIGIRTASIHYHYPTKSSLIEAIVDEREQEFCELLTDIRKRSVTSRACLQAFARIFQQVFAEGDRLCLFCMLASAQDAIPETIQKKVAAFWHRAAVWLTEVIRDGQLTDDCRSDLDAQTAAFSLMSALEGAMLTARAGRNLEQLQQVSDFIIDSICESPDKG